jgi:hypothetical protein
MAIESPALETAKPSENQRKTQTPKGVRFTPPPPPPGVRARSAARASPRLLGIASAACFGAPLGLACVPQLHAPPRCWCTYSGHLPLGAPTRRVEQRCPLLPNANSHGHGPPAPLPYRSGGQTGCTWLFTYWDTRGRWQATQS